MDAEKKALWTEALRSGEYEQGDGWLNMDGKFCCLGVLCDVAVKNGLDIWVTPPHDNYNYTAYGDDNLGFGGDAVFLPREVAEWAGMVVGSDSSWKWRAGDFGSIVIDDVEYQSLTHLNDNHISFEVIADVIDERL